MDVDVPFSWQMRLSKRAKRARLTISNAGKVELVWPHRMSTRYIAKMLHEHTAWVLKQLANLGDVEQQVIQPPSSIDLQAIGQAWQVSYQPTQTKLVMKEAEQVLIVSGNISDKVKLQAALKSWVKKQGRAHLKPWLQDVAQDMGLSYQSVSIRLQKKRWGSCSAKGNLNLNASLLFLPDFLVRHVLIHELAHLKHLNHSAAFWQHVAMFDADYQKNRRLLQRYSKDVPAWLATPFTI